MKAMTLGTRGSRLALAQAELAAGALRAAHPSLDVRLRIIKTSGDKAQDKPLSEIGGAGVFVKEIEHALLRGEIDAAVHSAKDLPSQLPEGLVIAACLPRADPRDALAVRAGASWLVDIDTSDTPFAALPEGANIGTGSVRRGAFIRMHRPDAHVLDLRGNVDSRLKRLIAGEFDALVLAMAGLERLSRLVDGDVRVIPISIEHMLPAVAQGTLALEARADDAPTLALLSAIDHSQTHATLRAERAFLRAFDAGCQAPIAAFTQVGGGSQLRLRGVVGLPDGTAFSWGEHTGHADQAEALGASLAQRVLRAGGQTVLDVMRDVARPLAGKGIVLTRAPARGESLAIKLRALGATATSLPVIAHMPPNDGRLLDAAMNAVCAGTYDWLALTSANAAYVIADWLAGHGTVWPARTRLAVVGEATARACEDALLRTPEVMPAHYNAAALAAAMAAKKEVQNTHVLLPNADIAQPALQTALQAAGMRVDRVIAYRTVCADIADAQKNALSESPADAIVFASSSTVTCFANQFAHRDLAAVCIGALTARAAQNAGFKRVATAPSASEDGLIAALLRTLGEGKMNDE